MSSTLIGASSGSQLAVMARLEARRFARHPLFLVGCALAFGLTIWMATAEAEGPFGDVLSTPVISAFFIGLFSLVVAARLTRSVEGSQEAMATVPGSEATRTAAIALACFVPFVAGVLWTGMLLGIVAWRGVVPQEWWFSTMSDVQLWSILIALGPVACLGGALLGVVTGRWLRFPGAPAVVVVATIVLCMLSMYPAQEGPAVARLVVPWAPFHSGTNTDSTVTLFGGNAAFYLLYLLCLCAGAALVAMWRDRTARTARLRGAIAGVAVLGLLFLGLAMTTGPTENQVSPPVPETLTGL